MDLVLISLYTIIPPGRALEVRTLEIYVENEIVKFNMQQELDKNYVILRLNGDVMLYYANFKTSKKFGRDVTLIEVIRSHVYSYFKKVDICKV